MSFMVHSIHSNANVALEAWSIAAAPANTACFISYPMLAADVGDVLAEATRLGFGDAVAVSAETGMHRVPSSCCSFPHQVLHVRIGPPALHVRLAHQTVPAVKHTFWYARCKGSAAGEGMMDLYTALQPHVTEAAARAAEAAAAEQQAAQDDADAAASRDKQISLTLMGLPNVVRSDRVHHNPSPLSLKFLGVSSDNPVGDFTSKPSPWCRGSPR